jgi:hypothetical protein
MSCRPAMTSQVSAPVSTPAVAGTQPAVTTATALAAPAARSRKQILAAGCPPGNRRQAAASAGRREAAAVSWRPGSRRSASASPRP